MMDKQHKLLTANHWGVGVAEISEGRIRSVRPHPDDPAPSEINDNIAGSLGGEARVLRPAIRAGWLDHGPLGKKGERGREPFVEVDWDTALDLITQELTRVRDTYGNDAIFAGSYGWSSAGRFHHAQSQLKRFLNTQGGFVRSEGNYSYNAALVLMPHIVGPFRAHVAQATRWSVIAKNTDLVVMFGGMAGRNTQVSDGGVTQHRMLGNLRACVDAGVSFINFSPLSCDADRMLEAEWLPPLPGTDVAVMMGLAHVLLTEGLFDQAFLDRYTVGFDKVADYLRGNVDGVEKTPEWAEAQSGISAERLRKLAREMAAGRTMISTAAGLQRTDFGEQPLWMTVTLAAMLGQIGLPGGGYTIGYGVNANIGNIERPFRWGTMSQGRNPVENYIPVAMISEMLLNPGGKYRYNGETRQFPDTKLVWWAGGNPFHHHQNLNKLRRAFQAPETVIVNEINWTSTARHADIVLPVAAAEERVDFGGGKSDNAVVPMPMLAPPPGEARVEFDIYDDLANRLDGENNFSEGKSQEEWIRATWQKTRYAAEAKGYELPDWDTFIKGDVVSFPDPSPDQVFLADFRADPEANALPTPSGKLELYSETIAGFGYEDCPGQAVWRPQRDVTAGKGDLYLVSGQPRTRLHSQLDNGAYSMSHKIAGREPVLINPEDAHQRGIADGDVVELSNERGKCLAGAVLSKDIRIGCVFLWTGAWYDPDFSHPDHLDRHGNPNVLTHDMRTSSLAQATAAHSARIFLRKWDAPVPEVRAHKQPEFRAETGTSESDELRD